MSGTYRHEKNCLNCGYTVEKNYCTQCGQPNLELKEPFWGFISHSIGHYFHFDSKFFHTLIPLLTKPGQLTLDYLAGKRARYIHPVSLYIFVSIVYFLIVPHALDYGHHQKNAAAEKVVTLKDSKLTDKEDLEGLPEILADQITNSEYRALSFKAQQHILDSLNQVYDKAPSTALKYKIDRFKVIHKKMPDSTFEAYSIRQKALPKADQDNWITRQFKKKQIYINQKKDKDHWDIKEEVKKYQPKQFFLLMPLLAFFIMLNFRKNRIYYIDHLVFTIHGMTAFFIISSVAVPIKQYVFGENSPVSLLIGWAVFAGIVWYLYTGLKLFYNRSVSMTIKKTITVIVLYYITFALSEWAISGVIKYFIA
ncbi:hypothetical protein HDF26_001290 [Pedobacter cryoconitis]|uniref:DUF3667 domain-containing protein n=1 Tax=Pedobacter cryoconitis TaxID=188932 RepID=UPI001611BBEB|nr:DUF3667 domain-containing protein [Pedobacter cryoconitis]MBB6270863.1 hypothetical protein [Pedobacter cryoconitis]